MEILLVYSNKCKNSQVVKKYEIFNKIDKLNIDNKHELKMLPKYVKSVPTLIIKKNEDDHADNIYLECGGGGGGSVLKKGRFFFAKLNSYRVRWWYSWSWSHMIFS